MLWTLLHRADSAKRDASTKVVRMQLAIDEKGWQRQEAALVYRTEEYAHHTGSRDSDAKVEGARARWLSL